MSILLNSTFHPKRWYQALSALLPDLPIQEWPDVPHPEAVQFAVVWSHDPADLHRYPNLRAIMSVTAGVEQLATGGYPDVPIVRLADPAMANEMAAFAVHWVVRFQRQLDETRIGQAQHQWVKVASSAPQDYPVGLLGYGIMGRRMGEIFTALGFPVTAWQRTAPPTDPAGVSRYHGEPGLDKVLANSLAVINLLPDTPQTKNLMNGKRFATCRPGAVYIAMGRGSTTQEADLIQAVEEGTLRAAVLDVTQTEPLPSHSPLWDHPRIFVTPHIAGPIRPETAAPVVAANIRRVQAGEDPFPLLEENRSY